MKLPDGSEKSGYTDANGKARIEDLEDAGDAEISFTRLHGDEVEKKG